MPLILFVICSVYAYFVFHRNPNVRTSALLFGVIVINCDCCVRRMAYCKRRHSVGFVPLKPEIIPSKYTIKAAITLGRIIMEREVKRRRAESSGPKQDYKEPDQI